MIRLLGVTTGSAVVPLRAALAAIPGPTLWFYPTGPVTAVGQADAGPPAWLQPNRRALLQGLQTVQRRLEAACAAGPFLPADPASCTAPEAALHALLAAQGAALAAALADAGRLHQWDVVLRWSAEAVVAAQRDTIGGAGRSRAALADAVADALARDRAARLAALRACLAPVTRAQSDLGGGPADIGLTVLVPAGGEAAIEAALHLLPAPAAETATVDLRGPLPPVSFAAFRLSQAEPGDLARAWRTLGLAARSDLPRLRHAWTRSASLHHPDHAGAAADGRMADANAAYRMLRQAMAGLPAEPISLRDLQRHAAYRLTVPDALPAMAA